MKTIFFTLCSVLVSCFSFGQTVYYEDFDSGSPAILGLVDNDSLTNSSGSTETWAYSPRSRAFANASFIAITNFCLRSITNPSPAVSGQQSDDWIQLPRINIPVNGQLIFKFQAESNVSQWSGYPNLEIKVSTTDSSLTSYSTIKTITNCKSWFNNHSCDLSAFAGQDVYVAIVNTTFNPPGWFSKRIFIDDIYVGALPTYDMESFSYKPNDFAQTGVSKQVDFNALNFGSATITSFNLNYQIDSGPIITSAVTGTSIASLDSISFSHPDPWIPASQGTYQLKIWADQLNGNLDNNPTNDTIYRTIEVFDFVTIKKPLLEIFGGSDCGACSPLAEDIEDFVDAWNFNSETGSISNIEYQTFSNDPSDNNDAQIRDTFYGVTGYPDEQITEGSDYKDFLLDDALHTFKPFFNYKESPLSTYPAFVEIDLNATYNSNTLNVDVELNPLVDFISPNLILHIAVCEKEYTYTGGTTNQTEFLHVMRKMLPDAYGISTGPLSAGVTQSFSESYTFSIGGVTYGSFNLWEGMHNLEVVAFLQDNSSNEVFQSASLSTDEILGVNEFHDFGYKLHPNPASSFVWIHNNLERDLRKIEIVSFSGQVIHSVNVSGTNKIRVNIPSVESGLYFVRVFDGDSNCQTQKLVISN